MTYSLTTATLLAEMTEVAEVAEVADVTGSATGTAGLMRKIADPDRKASGRMFEKFTDRARRVIVLGQEEARLLKHNYIGTEHILLGLIQEGEGVGARALESLGVSLEAVRQQVTEIIGEGLQVPSGPIAFTSRAKRVLELSLRESLQLGHNYIGTEHILLGLTRPDDSVAAQVLNALGADPNRVRQQVLALLHGSRGKVPGPEADVLSGRNTVESRLSVIEQRVGIGPDTADLDQEIRQARIERSAPLAALDADRAASLDERERELLAERATRHELWAAVHPDLPSLAEKVRELSEKIEELRGLLRQQGPESAEDPT